MATLRELLARLRSDLDDPILGDAPPLWTDEELVSYINDAEREAALRARLIRDATTRAIATFALRPGVAEYELDRRVVEVISAQVEGADTPLDQISVNEFPRRCSRWRTLEAARPTDIALDYDRCVARVRPIPNEVGLVEMIVARLPRTPLVLANLEAEPELAPHHHVPMLEWAKFCAYSRADADAHDPDAAARHAGAFAVMFGDRRSASAEQVARRHRGLRVRAHF